MHYEADSTYTNALSCKMLIMKLIVHIQMHYHVKC